MTINNSTGCGNLNTGLIIFTDIASRKNPFIRSPLDDNLEVYENIINSIKRDIKNLEGEVLGFMDMMGYTRKELSERTSLLANQTFGSDIEGARKLESLTNTYSFLVRCFNDLSPEDKVTAALYGFPEV